MRKTLWEIAKLVGGKLEGSPQIVVSGLAGIENATPYDITFLDSPRKVSELSRTRAAAIVITDSLGVKATIPAIYVPNADQAFAKLAMVVQQERDNIPPRVHPNAVVNPKAKLGKLVSIGACTVIEEGAQVGDNVVIGPLCYIGRDTQIGANTRIYSNVAIRDRCIVGERCVIHSGAVIGADGFGFQRIEDHYEKIPQVGSVLIEDDVEIGANTTIDRARLDQTIVGAGTKIDNLVMIGHSVQIGKNCILVGQVGIAGSSVIGDNCILAGQVGVIDHVTITDGVVITAQTGVSKNIPEPGIYSGSPVGPQMKTLREWAAIRKLPELLKEVSELRRKVASLEKPK
jgi:UDP-3-O-[3-hydroxymyristoyl] glucosamine N-acyltransferase